MSATKIKQLEELVNSALDCLEKLYLENRHLEQRVNELEKEKEASSNANEKAKDSLEKLKKLEAARCKLEKDNLAVRIKVKNVLQKIEKMDFV